MTASTPTQNSSQISKSGSDFTLRQNLTVEFQNKDYRYAYAESFLNTKLASQIKTLRQQRDMTQSQVAEVMDIKQPGYARFEDVNHSVWKTDTLWDIARALGVRVNISFESFGSLIEEKEHFDKAHLERPTFSEDPVFKESPRKRTRRKIHSMSAGIVSQHSSGRRKLNRKPPRTEHRIAAPMMAAAGSLETDVYRMGSGNNNSANYPPPPVAGNMLYVSAGNNAYGK